MSETLTVGRIINPEEHAAGEPAFPPAEPLDKNDHAEDAEEDAGHAVEHGESKRETMPVPAVPEVDAMEQGEGDRDRRADDEGGGEQDERADEIVKNAAVGADEADLFGEKPPAERRPPAAGDGPEDQAEHAAGRRGAQPGGRHNQVSGWLYVA